jgi:hypothetical protein
MALTDAPLLLSLELHIPVTGESRAWWEPRDLSHLTPTDRQQIMQHILRHVDALAGALQVRLTWEPAGLTREQIRAILDGA